jgi:D-aspartate ligase
MSHGNDDFVPIILGTNINTYNVARSLHEAYGVRSLALGRYPLRETAHSRIVDVRTYRDFDTPEVVVRTLLDLAEELPGRRRLLIPNIELYATILLEHRAELEEHFVIPLVDAELAGRLMNKTTFAQICADLGVPHPATVVVTPDTPRDVTLGADLPFDYPVVVKPSDTDAYPRLRFEGKQKVYVVDDAAGLRSVADRVYGAGYTDDLVVQELIPGDETVMRVANAYSDRSGRMRVLSIGQVALAEWDPRWAGNYNAILTIEDEALAASIRQLLDGLGYVGPANLDVMYDRRDGTSKILEVNLRLGACSFYARAAGANLPRCFVEDLVHGAELPELVTTEERLWVNLPYLAALPFVPRTLRRRVRAAARHGIWHTLYYRPDRSLARLLDVVRIDLRHTLDYVRYARTRLNR